MSFGLHPWPLFLCAVAAVALAALTYRRSVPRLVGVRNWMLVFLRSLSLFLVLFLLFQPTWSHRSSQLRPAVLAVLVDDSESLGLASEGAPPGQAVQNILASLPSFDGDARLFGFSDALQSIPSQESLRFDGARTNIAGALSEIKTTLAEDNLRGVLLLTDGQYNTGRNPIYTAEEYGVAIHTVAIGDTLHRRDLQIRRVVTNEIAYVNRELPIQVGLRTEGLSGEEATVSLMRGAEVLGSQRVRLPNGSAEIPIDLAYAPTEEGLHQLRVVATQLDGEVTYRNNTETITVRVLQNKRRVLLLAAAPGPDLATITHLLRQDGQTEIISYVQKEPGIFYEGAFPSSLTDVDLILLAGYPGPGARSEEIEAIARGAEGGIPILFLVGRQTNMDAVRDLGASLPIVPERRQPGFGEASIAVTPVGQQHPILDIPQQPASLDHLPPLQYHQNPWEASLDARVLARVALRGVELSHPLLVVRNRAGNRSAALLGSGTWRWSNLPEDLEDYNTFWPALFDNLVQWLTTPEDNRPVRIQPVQDIFGGNDAIQFAGQVYDESLNPVSDASVVLNLTAPDGTRYPYQMEALASGRYVLDIGTLPEGSYAYEAVVSRRQEKLGRDSGAFTVGALTLEFKETRANAPLLRQIAHRSGGQFFTPASLHILGDVLAADSLFRPVTRDTSRTTDLWRLPLFGVLVVLLLATEWILRKRWGLV